MVKKVSIEKSGFNEKKEFDIKKIWLEIVSPRVPFTYDKQVIILVNHWTGSMGEGIAIGFNAMGNVKNHRDKNGSSSEQKRISNLLIEKFLTAFRLKNFMQVNGIPRDNFIPDYLIDLNYSKYEGVEDAILVEVLKVINAVNHK